ncbi:9112_t:CDS:2, partial [Dentiscutata erythropus]
SPSIIKSLEVVIPPDQMTGRGLKNLKQSPIKLIAENKELVPKPSDDLSSNFDIGVVVSFGYFLPSKVIESFTKGTINIHPSLLPKYRGASPIQYTILNGDEKTGITIQELHKKIFDAGKVLRKVVVPVPPYITYSLLESMLAREAPKISKDMSFIKWNHISVKQLDQLHRAISHQ